MNELLQSRLIMKKPKKDLQKITKCKPTHQKKDWKKFEKNYQTIALDVLHAKKEKLYPGFVLKHNSNREKKVILLMILKEQGWHHLEVKKYQHY